MADVIVLIFFLIFVINISIQLISLVRLINFLETKRWKRTASFTLLTLLTVLYINDVLCMLMYSWGAPAISMTRSSYDIQNNAVVVVNGFNQCIYDASKKEKIPEFYQALVNLLAFSRRVSKITPLVWTIVLYLGVIYLQKKELIQNM